MSSVLGTDDVLETPAALGAVGGPAALAAIAVGARFDALGHFGLSEGVAQVVAEEASGLVDGDLPGGGPVVGHALALVPLPGRGVDRDAVNRRARKLLLAVDPTCLARR